MYTRRSKRRYKRSVERIRFYDEASCFKVICITFIILTSSCSSLFNKNAREEFESFEQAWKSVCLSGEGKGQIKYITKKYSFSYEMLLKKREWIIGMTFPFHGEELLKIGFEDLDGNGHVEVGGSFINRVRSELRIKRGGPKTLRLIESLFVDMGNFLTLLKLGPFNSEQYLVKYKTDTSGVVLLKNKKLFKWTLRDDGVFRIIMKKRSKYSVYFDFYNSEKFSNRVDIKLLKQGQSDTEKGLIELNLAIINCNAGH